MIETFLQDVRHAFRMLRRNVRYIGIAVLTLALGIGASTAVFSVIHAILLKPPPYERADQLCNVFQQESTDETTKTGWSYANFEDLIKDCLSPGPHVVFLGSVATPKYVEPLLEAFGRSLFYPSESLGRGDMSPGSMHLRCTCENRELNNSLARLETPMSVTGVLQSGLQLACAFALSSFPSNSFPRIRSTTVLSSCRLNPCSTRARWLDALAYGILWTLP